MMMTSNGMERGEKEIRENAFVGSGLSFFCVVLFAAPIDHRGAQFHVLSRCVLGFSMEKKNRLQPWLCFYL